MFNALQHRKRIQETVDYLKQRWGSPPEWAIIFGSGLGKKFLEQNPPTEKVSFWEIPNFHAPEVEGHPGIFACYDPNSKKKSLKGVVLQGRSHVYQGLTPQQVVLPLQALALWGVKRFVLTNASGSIHPKYAPGRLVLLTDHLNFTGCNPLTGPNLDLLGPRFPSLNKLYQNPLATRCAKIAQKLKIPLLKGVYVGISGPSYETAAEVKAFRKLGGHLIGMSTVHEAIALGHAGCEVVGLSAVTNRAGSDGSHKEVLSAAQKVDVLLGKLLWGMFAG